MKWVRVLLALAAALLLPCVAQAAITCTSLTSPGVVINYQPNTVVTIQSVFAVTCTRGAADPLSVSYSVRANNGTNPSGVNNKAAFLMADGGTFNGQTITGLGITKAARIYYTVNNSMLISGSDYADLANALRQACTNLIGTDGITAADCTEVNEIVLATEMDQNPTTSPTRSATEPSSFPVRWMPGTNRQVAPDAR